MTRLGIVFDAGALDGDPLSAASRALVERSVVRGGTVWACAVNLAEVCRGKGRTQAVEAFLRRGVVGTKLNLRVTDEAFAKKVGMILHHAGKGSESLADAHVVALCAEFDTAIVLTSDASDINELAIVVPTVRIVTRTP